MVNLVFVVIRNLLSLVRLSYVEAKHFVGRALSLIINFSMFLVDQVKIMLFAGPTLCQKKFLSS